MKLQPTIRRLFETKSKKVSRAEAAKILRESRMKKRAVKTARGVYRLLYRSEILRISPVMDPVY